jgi:hypothetical protein
MTLWKMTSRFTNNEDLLLSPYIRSTSPTGRHLRRWYTRQIFGHVRHRFDTIALALLLSPLAHQLNLNESTEHGPAL